MISNKIQYTNHKYIAHDKTMIHTTQFFNDSNTETLLILHGAAEHGQRYLEFAEYLHLHKINSVMMDFRGYGQSGGKRAHWPDFNTVVTDVCMIASDILQKKQNLHLFGHSMGGLVAARSAATLLKNKLRSLNLSSPCFGLTITVPQWKKKLAKVLSILAPSFTFPTPKRPDILTHDKAVINTYLADPLIIHRMSARLFSELQINMERAMEFAAKITCPTIILQAGDDKVVSSIKSESFYKCIQHTAKEFKLIESAYHEILQEVDRGTLFNEYLKHIQNNSG